MPALLLLLRQTIDSEFRVRFKLVHALLAALAVWTLASVFWADDRFLALISACRIAGGAALFWATSQIATRSSHLRVIVGVVVGILLVNVVQGALYQNVELADLATYYKEHKADVLAQHGWKEGDYVAAALRDEAAGRRDAELQHLGERARRAGRHCGPPRRSGRQCSASAIAMIRGWAGALVICALSSVYILKHTGSKASWAALVLGVALLGGWITLRDILVSRKRTAFFVGLAAISLGIVGVVAFGLAKGRLPSDSLNFRWRYWVGSWHLFVERPLTGIGWGNFADAYLRHRVPAAAEEIQDPHSFLVRWAVEIGAIGLVLGVAWLIAWAWAVLVPSPGTPDFGELSRVGEGQGERLGLQSESSDSQSQKALTLTLSQSTGRGDQKISRVLLALVPALLLTLACTIDFAGDPNYAILEIARRSMYPRADRDRCRTRVCRQTKRARRIVLRRTNAPPRGSRPDCSSAS